MLWAAAPSRRTGVIGRVVDSHGAGSVPPIPAAILAAGLALSLPAAAASQDLEARRDAAFAAMFRDPADLDLMLTYARLSLETRDYEQVVATLERYLDLRPEDQAARLELAVAYYALGAYEIARYHLGIVRTAPDLPPEIAAEIARYDAIAEQRTDDSAVTGYVEGGPAYAGVAGEAGAELGFGLVWRVSPEGASDRRWLTELAVSGVRFPGDDDLSVGWLFFRTGPEFSLTQTTYNWWLRPYLGATSSVDFDLDARHTLGFGATVSNSFSATLSGFAELEAGGVKRTGPDSEGWYGTAVAGLTWYPARDTALTLALRGRRDDTDSDLTDLQSYGARLALRQAFKPGWAASDRKWQVTAYVQQDRQEYVSLSPSATDRLFGYGASARAYLVGDTYLELRADILHRDTDFDDVATRRELYGLLLGREF